MALLFLDLDDFKLINDRFGHQSATGRAQEFARRLAGCVRKGDTVARLGGDEFTVLAEGVDSLEHAESIAHKIIEAMEPRLEEPEISFSVSIGISLYRAPEDASQFLLEADRAITRPSSGGARATKRRRARSPPERKECGGTPDERHAGPSPAGAAQPHWKHDGVRVIPADRLDPNTAQTPAWIARPRSPSRARARRSCGPAPCTSIRTRRPAHTTTARSRA
jgi:diguanylate cyclase (GGDEF)-like protein